MSKKHIKKHGSQGSIKDLSRKILDTLKKSTGQSLNYKQISAKIGVKEHHEHSQVLQKLELLKAQQRIEESERGKYCISKSSHYHVGTLDVSTNGRSAYFVCDELEHDVYIPSINLGKGLHGDTVRVYVYNKKRKGKLEADVVEIIERSKTSFVGVLQLSKNFGFVVPDNRKMYVDIFVPLKNLNGAENGDKVIVSLREWPERSKNPFGKITEVLGKPGDHSTEIHSILSEYNLPFTFSNEVSSEAENLPIEITTTEIKKRKDLRKVPTFTIDPADAKDFDDALSFQILENGHIEVGVHIADVSHYVQPDTLLDEEAYNRATSVYLVDRVVPMLPEVLSNNVCSLRPLEEKLTFSAVFELNEKAHIINQWFGRTVIYSDKRFAYEDAQKIIESNNTETNDPIEQAILTLDMLAKKLRKKRLEHGAITFDKQEVKFNLDENAEPLGVFFKESKDANKLIEEFMLLANKKVAEFVGLKSGKPSKDTFIYRIHDEPNMDKLIALQNVIGKFGYSINTKTRDQISKSLNKLLKDVHGKSESNMIETLTIRSMSKAIYTTDNIGHYGLAFDYYSHFTSPIRRYPDILTHRLLQHYLDGKKSPDSDVYETKCKHSSNMEQLATKAERDSIKYMQVKYMQNHINDVFEGIISGVTDWGIYIEISENKCEGMVKTRDIKDDFYIYDEKLYALVGQSTGNQYQLGDKVTVSVKNADLERKLLDFYLVQ